MSHSSTTARIAVRLFMRSAAKGEVYAAWAPEHKLAFAILERAVLDLSLTASKHSILTMTGYGGLIADARNFFLKKRHYYLCEDLGLCPDFVSESLIKVGLLDIK